MPDSTSRAADAGPFAAVVAAIGILTYAGAYAQQQALQEPPDGAAARPVVTGTPAVLMRRLEPQNPRTDVLLTMAPPGSVIPVIGPCPEGWIVATAEDGEPLFVAVGQLVRRDGTVENPGMLWRACEQRGAARPPSPDRRQP